MIGASQSQKKKASISEDDISLILQRYTATTILALLQEVAQFSGVKIDWNALVKKTSTGISNAREYQMLWRHLAYRDTLLEKLEDGAEPVDDDSDLEIELEPSPAVNVEASMEAAACVKVLIASGTPNDSGPSNRATVEAPLTINIPNGQTSRTPLDNPQHLRSTLGMNITVPVSVQKQSLPSVPSSEQLDGNGSGSSNLPPRRKRKLWTEEEDMELIAAVQKCGEGNWANILKGDFKHDRTASQLSQRWAIIRKKKPNLKPSTSSKSSGPTLTEAQLAARQAVSMALNMPMMGSLSSASAAGTSQAATQATPSNASSHSAATTSETSTLPAPLPDASTMAPVSSSSPALHQSQQAPNPLAPPKATSNPTVKSRGGQKKQSYPVKCSTGPNPIVQAAAVAAGARIANPVTAATLFRAAQSKTAVHIRQGGSVPASSLPAVANPLANNHVGARPANIHYIRTGLASPPPVFSSKAQIYQRPVGQHVQGGLGKLPSTGQPSGSTAPSSRPAQQGCLDPKTLSHLSRSPQGKTETKRNLIITNSDTGIQSTLEKTPADLSQAPNGPVKEQVLSANLILKDPIKEPVASANLAPKDSMKEQVSSANSVAKDPMKEQVLTPSSVLMEEEATSLHSVQEDPVQEQLTSVKLSKEPVQELAGSPNFLSKEPIQEQIACLNSNGGKDHETLNVADYNQAVTSKQTIALDQTAAEKSYPNTGENQSVVCNGATENQMPDPLNKLSETTAPTKAVGENQATIEKQMHFHDKQSCKIIASTNGKVETQYTVENQTILLNADASRNQAAIAEAVGGHSDSSNSELGDKNVSREETRI